MKKILSLLAAGALLFAACCKDTTETPTKSVTFNCNGDWQQTKDLSANGSSMTDIWVFDYVGGVLQQTITQSDNTASDFGTPTLNLTYGTHTLYFVTSRGITPTVNTTNHNITWVKPSDTFHKTLSITVDANTTGQTVTLERVVAKLKMTINDAIATGTTAFLVTPLVLWTRLHNGRPPSLYHRSSHHTQLPFDIYRTKRKIHDSLHF